jgi:hypothetical protein
MRILAAFALALAQLAAASASAEGEIWVWTTADGSVHYTDDRERIPEAFRGIAREAQREGGGSYQRISSLAPSEPVPSAGDPAPPAAEAPLAPYDAEAAAEASWREQARGIDERIAALSPQAEACGNDHVNRSPGDGSRRRREEREEAERCARAKQDLATARADREALEERAHRADVPPGWVRPQD